MSEKTTTFLDTFDRTRATQDIPFNPIVEGINYRVGQIAGIANSATGGIAASVIDPLATSAQNGLSDMTSGFIASLTEDNPQLKSFIDMVNGFFRSIFSWVKQTLGIESEAEQLISTNESSVRNSLNTLSQAYKISGDDLLGALKEGVNSGAESLQGLKDFASGKISELGLQMDSDPASRAQKISAIASEGALKSASSAYYATYEMAMEKLPASVTNQDDRRRLAHEVAERQSGLTLVQGTDGGVSFHPIADEQGKLGGLYGMLHEGVTKQLEQMLQSGQSATVEVQFTLAGTTTETGTRLQFPVHDVGEDHTPASGITGTTGSEAGRANGVGGR